MNFNAIFVKIKGLFGSQNVAAKVKISDRRKGKSELTASLHCFTSYKLPINPHKVFLFYKNPLPGQVWPPLCCIEGLCIVRIPNLYFYIVVLLYLCIFVLCWYRRKHSNTASGDSSWNNPVAALLYLRLASKMMMMTKMMMMRLWCCDDDVNDEDVMLM